MTVWIAGAILVSLVLAFVVSRWFTRPVSDLTRFVHNFDPANAATRVPVISVDMDSLN